MAGLPTVLPLSAHEARHYIRPGEGPEVWREGYQGGQASPNPTALTPSLKQNLG
jgi:hypothetical protein